MKTFDVTKRAWQRAKAKAQAEKEQKAEEKRKARLMAGMLWTYDRRGRKKIYNLEGKRGRKNEA